MIYDQRIILATWHRVRIQAGVERFTWPTFFSLSPKSRLIQVEEFRSNKKKYDARLIRERHRVLGDNQHRQVTKGKLNFE